MRETFSMDVQAYLKDFKATFDPKLSAYFDARIVEFQKEDVLVAEAFEHVKTIVLSGGKRLRPAFMLAGYQAAGGDDTERLINASISVELIHMFLLIHDDIIDRDALRHGVPTLHEWYTVWGRERLGLSNPEHFGNSIALIVGDMLFALGNDVLFQSGFSHDRVLAALSKTQKIVSYTGIGEASDIYIEYKKQATSQEVLKMYEQKTARYTFEGPLHLGALLAGAQPELLEQLSLYALPLGIAFQIQDDLLGVFGDEARIGKPLGSDIQEGKLTLLVTTVLEEARAYRDELMAILCKGKALTRADIDRFRVIVTESGSVDRVKSLAQSSIQRAKHSLSSVAIPDASRTFLFGVTDYMLKREY